MAEKLPLVYIDGALSQLPPGDQVEGGELGNLIAGSGLVGGGDLQTGSKRLDVALAPNPSGVIFVGDTVGMDGADLVAADAALASGNAALVDAVPALASGVAGLADANTALASGNAALSDAANFVGSSAVILTASSTIQAGNPVGLDDTNRVQAVRELVDSATRNYGPQVKFEDASCAYTAITYDSSNNKVVIAYRDQGNSNYGTAIVGAAGGDSVSFGTAVVYESAMVSYNAITFDSTNNKVVIAYSDDGNSSHGTAVVGNVSGTSITFGTPVVFEAANSYYFSATYDSTNDRVVISYVDDGNSQYGTAVVGTVSGTSISFGTPVVFEAAEVGWTAITYDSTAGKVVIAYRDTANSSHGTAIVGTVSGTSISFGSPSVFQTYYSGFETITYDSSNDRVVISYYGYDGSATLQAVVGTVSGTSISFGTPVQFATGLSQHIFNAFDSNLNQVVIFYRDPANSNKGTSIVGTVSDTSISFGSSTLVTDDVVLQIGSTYDTSSQRIVVSYINDSDSSKGYSAVGFPATSALPTLGGVNNFIGTANSTVASGDSVKVNAPRSLNYSNAGLSTGYFYYVDPSASGFTTTATQPSSWTAGDYSWGPVAKAVSSSGLLILDTI